MSVVNKRLDELLADFLGNFVPNYRQNFFERNRQRDKIIVWLVGIATGFIVLIISQLDKLTLINPIVLKITILFSLLTILSGVVYRIIYYCCEDIQSELLFNLESFFIAYTAPSSLVPQDFSFEEDPKVITEYLKKEMDYDCDSLLKYNMPIEDWRDFYNKHIASWKKWEKEGLDRIQKLIADTFDIPGYKIFEKEGNVQTNNSKAKMVKRLEIWCKRLYICTLVSFSLAVITIGGYFVFFSKFPTPIQ